MRLEVLVDQQEPLIFPLNKDKIVIGSGEICDILLDAEGISRKHLIIHCSDDEFIIVDQGSTNGSYINEERLIPGRRVEFTSFFPVRLGDNVLLTLLSDEESQDFEISSFNSIQKSIPETDHETTRVIKASDLQNESSLKIHVHKKKASVRAKNMNKVSKSGADRKGRKPQAKPEKNLNIVIGLSLLVAIGAIYNHMTSNEVIYDTPQVAVVDSTNIPAENSPENKIIPKVTSEFFASSEDVNRIQLDFKCISPSEVELCNTFNLKQPYGVTQSGIDLFVFAPAKIDDEYREKLKRVYNNEDGSLPGEIYSLYFVMKHLVDLPENLAGFRIHIYLLDNENKPMSSVSFYKEGYDEFRRIISPSLLSDIILGGASVINFTKDYLTYH